MSIFVVQIVFDRFIILNFKLQDNLTAENLLFMVTFWFFPLGYIESGKIVNEAINEAAHTVCVSMFVFMRKKEIERLLQSLKSLFSRQFYRFSLSFYVFNLHFIMFHWRRWQCIFREKCRSIYVRMNWFSLFYCLDRTSPRGFKIACKYWNVWKTMEITR